jgi:hypothetical protein
MDQSDYDQFTDIENDYDEIYQPYPKIISQIVTKKYDIQYIKPIYNNNEFYSNLENGYKSNILVKTSGNIINKISSIYLIATTFISKCINDDDDDDE